MGLETVRRSKGYVLSGGERRRVEIARSLAIDPSFLLLDEPFSGIDPIQVIELKKIILDLKNAGLGILVTDHNARETLSVTDRAYIINAGKIFRTGTPECSPATPKSGAFTSATRLISTVPRRPPDRIPRIQKIDWTHPPVGN